MCKCAIYIISQAISRMCCLIFFNRLVNLQCLCSVYMYFIGAQNILGVTGSLTNE